MESNVYLERGANGTSAKLISFSANATGRSPLVVGRQLSQLGVRKNLEK
jgi:hypothetical protein